MQQVAAAVSTDCRDVLSCFLYTMLLLVVAVVAMAAEILSLLP
jgi:hypothetical protein